MARLTITEKVCTKCVTTQLRAAFYEYPSGGLSAYCKPCMRVKAKAQRDAGCKPTPEKTSEYSARYYAKNVEVCGERNKACRQANPYPHANSELRRRAAKAQAQSEHVDREMVYDRDNGMCGICHVAVDKAQFHLDHIQPLSRGGSHTYSNVQASHPACNIRKGAKAAVLVAA